MWSLSSALSCSSCSNEPTHHKQHTDASRETDKHTSFAGLCSNQKWRSTSPSRSARTRRRIIIICASPLLHREQRQRQETRLSLSRKRGFICFRVVNYVVFVLFCLFCLLLACIFMLFAWFVCACVSGACVHALLLIVCLFVCLFVCLLCFCFCVCLGGIAGLWLC